MGMLFVKSSMTMATINLLISFRKTYNFYEQGTIFCGIASTLHIYKSTIKGKNRKRSHRRDHTKQKIRHTTSHQEVYERQVSQ